MWKKRLLLVFVLLLCTNALAFAATSYEEERKLYLEKLNEIVKEVQNSDIEVDLRLNEITNKAERDAILAQLQKDIVTATAMLHKNKIKLQKTPLTQEKLITANQKIIQSFDASAIAMQGISSSIDTYNVPNFLKNLFALRQEEDNLRSALKSIDAEYLMKNKK